MSSLLGEIEPSFQYYQKFYKTHTKITLLNNGNTKNFESDKNLNYNTVRNIVTNLESNQEQN